MRPDFNCKAKPIANDGVSLKARRDLFDAPDLRCHTVTACSPKRLQSPDAVATRQPNFCSCLRNYTFPFSPLLAGPRFHFAGLGYIRETINLRTRRAAERKCLRLFDYGRYRTNVWTYAGVNGFGTDRSDLELHPTAKPVAMVEDAIRDCSRRKGVILGSGTTIIAAERAGRRGFGVEIDPAYCDVTLRRIQEHCGLNPTLRQPDRPSRK